MSYCDGCLHREVCSIEGVGDESLTFCKDRLGWIPVSEKCSKRKCPMQHGTLSDDCDIKDCPYRTENIEPSEFMRVLCNYIADLVLQELKAESEEDKR